MGLKEVFSGLEQFQIPFLPFVYGMAARLEQISVQEMASEPGALSRCLRNAQRLFGYDGILTSFDLTLEAEACGCQVSWDADGMTRVVAPVFAEERAVSSFDVSTIERKGRLPVVLEAAKRLCQELRGAVPVVGVVTGPWTLASYLRGEGLTEELKKGSNAAAQRILELAVEVALRVTRCYCEAGVNIVAIAEDFLPEQGFHVFRSQKGLLDSVWNVIRYYRVNSVLLVRGKHEPDEMGTLCQLGSGTICVSPGFDIEDAKGIAVKHSQCFAYGIPTGELLADVSKLRRSLPKYLASGDIKKFFLATEWEVPHMTPPENMHEIRSILQSFSKSN